MTTPGQSKSNPAAALATEVAAFWRQFPARGLFLGLLAGWVVLFQFWGNSTLGYVNTSSLFGWMHYSYQMNSDDAHGYFIPALVLVLLWWKKKELAPLPKAPWAPALGLVSLALALHVLGYLVQQTRISIVGFYFGVYALSGLMWGAPWLRATFFPFCLLAFCVPIGTLTEAITFPLRLLATNITVAIAHAGLGIDVIQQGTIIYDPTGRYQYEIAAACSGLRSLTALFALTLIYSFMFFNKYWQRGAIFLLAFPAAVLSNVIRLLMIIIAAQLFGQRGGDYVHNNSILSLLPYGVGMALVYFVGEFLKRSKRTAAPVSDDAGGLAGRVES